MYFNFDAFTAIRMARIKLPWAEITAMLFRVFEPQTGLPFGRFEANLFPVFQEIFLGILRGASRSW